MPTIDYGCDVLVKIARIVLTLVHTHQFTNMKSMTCVKYVIVKLFATIGILHQNGDGAIVIKAAPRTL